RRLPRPGPPGHRPSRRRRDGGLARPSHPAARREPRVTPSPPDDEVLVERDGPVLTLTFNRPAARNALTWNMYERLIQACEEVDADDEIRVFVLRGAGGKAF